MRKRPVTPRKAATLKEVADKARQPLDVVRAVLGELPSAKATRAVRDKIFGAARSLGYDLKKLKIGKRMQMRKETLTEVLRHCQAHPEWGRAEIVAYLERTLHLLDRVRRKVFEDEFGDPWV